MLCIREVSGSIPGFSTFEHEESKQTVADSSPALWIIFENEKICCFVAMIQFMKSSIPTAAIAQLGERQTEDLKVPGSIPGRGSFTKLEKSQHDGCLT